MGCLLKFVGRFFLVLTCLGIPPSVLTAQNESYPMGAAWDSSAYNTLPYFDWYIGRKGGDAPDKISLHSFCPPIADQGKTGACSGYAFGYSAMSIMYNIQAIKKGETGKNIAFSPNFVYNQIKKNQTDCTSPSLAEDAISLLHSQGICRLEDFNTQHDCMSLPDPSVLNKAAAFKIMGGQSVFPAGEPIERKIAAIKACLQDSMPVVVNMRVYKSFQNINSKGFWVKPYDEDDYLGKHYLTVIGYDDERGCFEVMNSWGQNWAKGGFAYVKYDQLATWCLAAYYLLLPNQVSTPKMYAKKTVVAPPQYQKSKSSDNAVVDKSATKPMLSFQGAFQLIEVQTPNGNEAQAVQWNSQKGFYERTNGSIAIDSRFQLKASDIPRGKYVYIFSCDPTGEVKLHFPRGNVSKRPSVAFMPYSNIELTIPDATHALSLKHVGDDYLCILYADEELPIESYLNKLRQSNYINKNFSSLLTDIVGQKLIGAKDIQYSPNAMFASATVQRGAGVAIPIILKVTAK